MPDVTGAFFLLNTRSFANGNIPLTRLTTSLFETDLMSLCSIFSLLLRAAVRDSG